MVNVNGGRDWSAATKDCPEFLGSLTQVKYFSTNLITIRAHRGHTWSEATYIIEGPNNGTVVVVVAPGCMKANTIANTTAKIIKKTSNAGLLLRPQPTVKKTPRNTPKARNIISR